MENPEYNVGDLVNFAAMQKPAEFENAINSIMQVRAAAAVQDRKMELAKGLFQEPVEDNSEYDADETEEDNDNVEEA